MDGVTVLNVIEKTQLPDWAIIGVVLCLFAMVVFFVGFSNGKTIKRIDICGAGLCCTLVLAFIFFLVGLFTSNTIPRYECTIDSDVSFVELYEKYNVIEQRGDIWVLEEKVSNGK